MCHKSVPNGVDFCDDCKVKMMNKADESYLDSLLSSVSGNSANPANTATNNATKDNAVDEIPVEDIIPDNTADAEPDIADLSDTSAEDIIPTEISDAEVEISDIPDISVGENSFNEVNITDDIADTVNETGDMADTSAEDIIPAEINDAEVGIEDISVEDSIPDNIIDTPDPDSTPDLSFDPGADTGSASENIDELSELLGGSDAAPAADDISLDDLLASLSDDMPEEENKAETVNEGFSDHGITDFMISDEDNSDEISDALDFNLNEPVLNAEELQNVPDATGITDIAEVPDTAGITDITEIPADAEDNLPEEVVPISDETGISTESLNIDGSDGPETGFDEAVPEETAIEETIPEGFEFEESVPKDTVIDETVPEEQDLEEIYNSASSDEEAFSEEPVSEDEISEEAIAGQPENIESGISETDSIESASDESGYEEPDNEIAEEAVVDAAEPETNNPDYESNEDMDELLSSLLADMDESKKNEESKEAPIEADDIESLFNTAEEMIASKPDEGTEESDLFSGEKTGEDIDAILDQSGLDSVDTSGEDGIDISDTDNDTAGAGIDIAAPDIDMSGTETDISNENEPGGIEGIDIGLGSDDLNIAEPADNAENPEGLIVSEDIDSLFSEIGTDGSNTYLGEDDLANSVASGDDDIDNIITEIDSGEFEERLKTLDTEENGKKSKKSGKKNWFQRLFGNITEDLTPEQIKERQDKAKAEEEAKKKAAEDKKKKAELSKEEKEAKKAEAKAAAAEAAKKKAEEKKRKAAEAKEKAKKKKEERLAIEEFEVDEGKINKAGATVLFVIFAAMTIFIIVGTNIYSYNLSIKNAQEDFEVRKYNEAYYEVYGLKVKDEDIDLYDKIMTVQYVNSELNSYEYYLITNNREKALDSLLKGLQRYDKYYELATRLGIEDDIAYVKSRILEKLASTFSLTESEAYDMLAIRDDFDYSEYLYSLLGTYDIELIP